MKPVGLKYKFFDGITPAPMRKLLKDKTYECFRYENGNHGFEQLKTFSSSFPVR